MGEYIAPLFIEKFLYVLVPVKIELFHTELTMMKG